MGNGPGRNWFEEYWVDATSLIVQFQSYVVEYKLNNKLEMDLESPEFNSF
jgi:hypothetical protein